MDKQFCRCPLRYYIQWSGYEGTDEEFSWVAADELNAPEAIEDFHSKPSNWTKLGPLSSL
ncbi:hypothetical protein MPER_09607 [Moniliophthora perniciosa FA553]|nr:hypothetical protein MPER_09607 [Moniliophthora perniciosa FA553]